MENTTKDAINRQPMPQGKAVVCPLPENCSLHGMAKGKGYQDAFAFQLKDQSQDARSVYLAIFGHLPKPVRFMISLRNKLVGVVRIRNQSGRHDHYRR